MIGRSFQHQSVEHDPYLVASTLNDRTVDVFLAYGWAATGSKAR